LQLVLLLSFFAGDPAPAQDIRDPKVIADFKAAALLAGERLGLGVGDVAPDTAQQLGLDGPRGAMVTQVLPGGVGNAAGLKVGDIILAVDSEEFWIAAALPKVLLSREPGDSVRLTVWRDRQAVEVLVSLAPLPPERENLRREEAIRVACVRLSCAECYATLKFAGNYMGEACDGCLKSSMTQIDACVASSRALTSEAPAPAVSAPAVAAAQASPVQPAFLDITRVDIVPATIAAGGRFSLEVSYTAPTAERVMFGFAISAGGRVLFASKTETIEGGNGKPMRHERSLGAASAPGIYNVRVRLTLGGTTVEREATLTVTAKQP
jgi:hypothetical protein